MIKIKRNNNKIVISGHALYDEYGKDIVCSSASSIVITSVNAILTFDEDYITYKEEKDKFTIKIGRKYVSYLLFLLIHHSEI